MLIGARNGAWKASGAPLPYDAEVDYIQFVADNKYNGSNDYQTLIDFGFRADTTTSMKVDMTPIGTSSYALVGYQYDTGLRLFNSGGRLYVDNGYFNPGRVVGGIWYGNERATIDCGCFWTKKNGVLVASKDVEYTFTASMNMRIAGYYVAQKTHSIAFYRNSIIGASGSHGELFIDCIAVRFKNENNVTEGALYDRVNGTLFRNSGTGAFIIGPDKT